MAKSFVKNLVGFSSESIINFIVSFLVVPIATRLFSTEAYGQVTLLQSTLVMCMVLPMLGQDQAFTRFYYDSKDKSKLLNINMSIIIVCWLFVFIGCVIFAKFLSEYLFNEVNVIAIILAAYLLLPLSLIRMSLLIYRMKTQVRFYVVQSVLYNLLTKLAILSAGFLHKDYTVYAISLTIFMTVFSILCFARQYKVNKVNVHLYFDWVEIKPYVIYGFPTVISAFCSQLLGYVPRFMIKTYAGFSELGIYSAAASLASTVNVIQAGFTNYFGAYLYGHYKEDKGEINCIHHCMGYVCFLATAALTLVSPIAVPLLGINYAGTQTVFPIMVIYLICYSLSETTVYGINIVKKTYLHIIITVLSVLAVYISGYLLIPKFGVIGGAMAHSLSAVVFFAARSFWGLRYYNPIKKGYKTIVMLFAAIFITIANWLFDDINILKYPLIAGTIVLISVLYIPYLKNQVYLIRSKGGIKG